MKNDWNELKNNLDEVKMKDETIEQIIERKVRDELARMQYKIKCDTQQIENRVAAKLPDLIKQQVNMENAALRTLIVKHEEGLQRVYDEFNKLNSFGWHHQQSEKIEKQKANAQQMINELSEFVKNMQALKTEFYKLRAQCRDDVEELKAESNKLRNLLKQSAVVSKQKSKRCTICGDEYLESIGGQRICCMIRR